MKRLFEITRHICLWVFIGWFHLSVCAQARATAEPPGASAGNHQDYLRLKDRFETLAQANSDPAILTCLAVETTAQAWTLAAAGLIEDPSARARWRAKAEGFEKSWSSGQNWERRHQMALWAYYEALSEVARQLAGDLPDSGPAKELAAIFDRHEQILADLADPSPEASLEKEVLSRGLMDLAEVIICSVGPGLDRPAGLISASAAEKTAALRERKDLHYRARLAFIYAAQLQGLTELIFLLAQTAGPSLSRPLAEIRAALEKTEGDPRLPAIFSLAWTAQAQISLPLAYWLSTRPAPLEATAYD